MTIFRIVACYDSTVEHFAVCPMKGFGSSFDFYVIFETSFLYQWILQTKMLQINILTRFINIPHSISLSVLKSLVLNIFLQFLYFVVLRIDSGLKSLQLFMHQNILILKPKKNFNFYLDVVTDVYNYIFILSF